MAMKSERFMPEKKVTLDLRVREQYGVGAGDSFRLSKPHVTPTCDVGPVIDA
jgi:hypothetical protein